MATSFILREIDDDLWRTVKSKAAREGLSLKQLALNLFGAYAADQAPPAGAGKSKAKKK
jgi:hypothetical protein